jgi:hypothetical protein
MKRAVDHIAKGLEKIRHKFDQDTILTLQYLIIEAQEIEIGFLQAEFQFGYEQAIDDMKEVEDD